MAIEFSSQNDFLLDNKEAYANWLSQVIFKENKSPGDISYVFCSDEYLHSINFEYLNHDTFTDIITFDYSMGDQLHAEVYISTERIADNASQFNVSFHKELLRVMVHGVLHLCGYKDHTPEDIQIMRSKEDTYIKLFSV